MLNSTLSNFSTSISDMGMGTGYSSYRNFNNGLGGNKTGTYNIITNYIYLYHLDQYVLIPQYPDQINDNMAVSFNLTDLLAGSLPIYSFQHSGPRSINIQLNLHREMLNSVNKSSSNLILYPGDDYIDTLVKQLQLMALPKYAALSKMVDPPMIAIRFGNDIFCKGVISGSVSVTYKLPILKDDKYACVDILFAVNEVDPFDAETVLQVGSYRGIDTSLDLRFWK